MPGTPLQFTLTPKSSLIAAHAYDPDQQMLVLRFQKFPVKGQPGQDIDDKAYGYPAFTPDRYEEFKSAESQGKYFYAHIKDEYPRGRFVYLKRDGTPQDGEAPAAP
jgi:hypothetical protein